MLASDPYLSHLAAASVQTAVVRETKDRIVYTTPPSLGALSAAPAQAFICGPLVVLTALVMLTHIAFGHVALR